VPGDARHSCLRLFHPLHVPRSRGSGCVNVVCMCKCCVDENTGSVVGGGGGAMSSWLQARDQQGWCSPSWKGTTIPWKGFFLSFFEFNVLCTVFDAVNAKILQITMLICVYL
jgi:hypothetical protein